MQNVQNVNKRLYFLSIWTERIQSLVDSYSDIILCAATPAAPFRHDHYVKKIAHHKKDLWGCMLAFTN